MNCKLGDPDTFYQVQGPTKLEGEKHREWNQWKQV